MTSALLKFDRKEFLGHKTLVLTERSVHIYLTCRKARYDVYRVKRRQPSASEMMNQLEARSRMVRQNIREGMSKTALTGQTPKNEPKRL